MVFTLQHRSVAHLDGTVSVELVRTDGGVHGAWVSEPSSDLIGDSESCSGAWISHDSRVEGWRYGALRRDAAASASGAQCGHITHV